MTLDFEFRISNFGFSTIHPGFSGRAEPNPKSEIRNPKWRTALPMWCSDGIEIQNSKFKTQNRASGGEE